MSLEAICPDRAKPQPQRQHLQLNYTKFYLRLMAETILFCIVFIKISINQILTTQ